MDGLLDEWIIGFEFKITQKPWNGSELQKAYKS